MQPFVVARDGGPGLDRLRRRGGRHRQFRRRASRPPGGDRSRRCDRARAIHRPAAALTFEPHPRSFFQPDAPSFRLSSEAAKLRLLAATGLDGAIVLTFDARSPGSPPSSSSPTSWSTGWRSAAPRSASTSTSARSAAARRTSWRRRARTHGFAVDVVPPFQRGGRRVSSGAIRDALAAGHVTEAAELLGYPCFVTAQVVHGDKRGRELGYPDRQPAARPDCGLKHGIYAVRVGVGGVRYDGVASFGRRPMFDNGAVLLEVFLFDFSGDLYGAALDVAFIRWIRPEMNFADVEELIRRMDEDSRHARTALARAPDAFPPLGVPA